jgi:hypothetical protein
MVRTQDNDRQSAPRKILLLWNVLVACQQQVESTFFGSIQ